MKKCTIHWKVSVKNAFLSFLLVAMLVASLSSCSTSDSTSEPAESVDGIAATSLQVEYSEEDMDDNWNAATATSIILSNTESKVNGSGANVISGTNTIQITQAGSYIISGEIADGQIVVEADKEDLVRIILNQASITCSDGAAIAVVTCDKVIFTLAEGTINNITGGEASSSETATVVQDAAIYSEKDLTINGAGKLNVNGKLGNGIATKDDLVITGGIINVTATNDALRGRDSIAINGGTFTLTAQGDALHSNNDVNTGKGWISIDGGTYNITAEDAGLKAESLLQVNNGNLIITSAYDSLHSNTNMNITGGTFQLTAGDDAMHSDALLNVSGGTINVITCYEGVESTEISISGGKLTIIAEDDGFNAAGGNDGSAQATGAPQQDNFAVNEDCIITFSGGTVIINSGGDGIDSNGSLAFSGGTVYVSGPTSDRDGPMDYNGTCQVTGGTLAIAGSAGMAQSPSETSSQNSITVFFDGSMTAGTSISVIDSQGNKVLSYAPDKAFTSIVLSSPDFIEGGNYTIYADSSILTNVTLYNTVNAISSDGSAVQSGGSHPAP